VPDSPSFAEVDPSPADESYIEAECLERALIALHAWDSTDSQQQTAEAPEGVASELGVSS